MFFHTKADQPRDSLGMPITVQHRGPVVSVARPMRNEIYPLSKGKLSSASRDEAIEMEVRMPRRLRTDPIEQALQELKTEYDSASDDEGPRRAPTT